MSPALTSPSSTTRPARALRSTLAAALLLVSGAASTVATAATATITMTPSTQTVNVGDSFAVKVSALDFDLVGYLGAYDFTVALGTAGIASLQSVTFAGSLGTGGDVSQSVTLPSFAETSLVFDLSTLQDADFDLATLNFKALAAGTTSIGLDPNLLGDGLGDAITGASFNTARVTVIGGGVPPIPEPSTYALMLAGLGALAVAARRRRG